MRILTADDIRALMAAHYNPCVSIFLPTHRRGKDVEQDPIRFKNLLRQAEERVEQQGLRKRDRDQMLAPARALLDNTMFWQHQSDGLAVFMRPGEFQEYRMPLDLDELVVVTDRYHLKPLLPLLSGDGRFYLLLFNLKNVRLFEGSRFSLLEVELSGMPKSLADAFDPDRYQGQLQFYTGAPTRGGGKRDAIFHGTGGSGEEATKEAIEKFCRQLDRVLLEFLKPTQAPLVLAGVDYLLPIYKSATKYPYLLDAHITGSQDETGLDELHTEAWEIVEPEFKRDQQRLWSRFTELHQSGGPQASADLKEIVPASVHGRLDCLFVGRKQYCWGSFNPDTSEVTVHEREQIGVRDLLDFAAINTLANNGHVYVVDPDTLPDGGPVAALFRY